MLTLWATWAKFLDFWLDLLLSLFVHVRKFWASPSPPLGLISLYGHARRLSSLGCISGLYVDLNLLEYEACGPCPLTTPYRKGSFLRTPRIARELVVLHIFLHLQLVAFKWASFTTSGFTLNAIHYKVDPTSNI